MSFWYQGYFISRLLISCADSDQQLNEMKSSYVSCDIVKLPGAKGHMKTVAVKGATIWFLLGAGQEDIRRKKSRTQYSREKYPGQGKF